MIATLSFSSFIDSFLLIAEECRRVFYHRRFRTNQLPATAGKTRAQFRGSMAQARGRHAANRVATRELSLLARRLSGVANLEGCQIANPSGVPLFTRNHQSE